MATKHIIRSVVKVVYEESKTVRVHCGVAHNLDYYRTRKTRMQALYMSMILLGNAFSHAGCRTTL